MGLGSYNGFIFQKKHCAILTIYFSHALAIHRRKHVLRKWRGPVISLIIFYRLGRILTPVPWLTCSLSTGKLGCPYFPHGQSSSYFCRYIKQDSGLKLKAVSRDRESSAVFFRCSILHFFVFIFRCNYIPMYSDMYILYSDVTFIIVL